MKKLARKTLDLLINKYIAKNDMFVFIMPVKSTYNLLGWANSNEICYQKRVLIESAKRKDFFNKVKEHFFYLAIVFLDFYFLLSFISYF